MVRNLNLAQMGRGWKAALAIAIAGGGLLWHILACTESPMAFSPDGRQLAFVTLEPYDGDQLEIAGGHAWRLMVLADRKDLRILEQSGEAMFTAPAYSPDGRSLCYLRIPLLKSEEEANREQEAARQRKQKRQSAEVPAVAEPARPAALAPADQLHDEDWTLPDMDAINELIEGVAVQGSRAASLVIRETDNYAVTRIIPVSLPFLPADDKGSFLMAYAMVRPEYSPDGKWIYFCAGDCVMAVNPEGNIRRMMAAPAAISTLSPDGQTLAVLQKKALCFMRTDGQSAAFHRYENEVSPSGMAWMDKETLAVLSSPQNADAGFKAEVRLVHLDGTSADPVAFAIPGKAKKENSGELAVSGAGKAIVVSYGYTALFLDRAGKVLGTWTTRDEDPDNPAADGWLVQPTFAPDGKVVAFKQVAAEGGYARARAIVYFTPDGKEISRVALPRVDPAATRPVRAGDKVTR